MPPSKKTDVESPAATAAESALSKYLKANDKEHFNFVEDVSYAVSTGSLGLDCELGLLHPSLVKLVGPSSSGKSSFALGVTKQFLATVPNSRAVYIKAEARLSPEIQERSGLTFVKDPDQWKNGTVFVFESNVYEVVIGLIRELITNNPNKHVYCFILDSMDGLNLRNDLLKSVDEANRVAGQPLMTKQFLQKVSVAMTKYGHLCFFLTQVSASIKLDPYAKDIPRQTSGASGNALQHFSSHVLEFQNWYESDLILQNPNERLNRVTNKAVGHTCKIKIIKTDREKRYVTVEIPIKHHSNGGGGIWVEREIGDLMLGWGLVTKAGSWLTLAPTFLAEMEKAGLTDLPEKVQGLNQLYDLLEKRQDVTAHLFTQFRNRISQ